MDNHVGLLGTEFSARGMRVPAGLTAVIYAEDYFFTEDKFYFDGPT